MKKLRRRRVPRVDGLFITTVISAVIVLHLLIAMAGWIAGQHETELRAMFTPVKPAPVEVARVAPPPPPPPRVIQPVKLTFAPLPPLEKPRVVPPPRLAHYTPDFYFEIIRDAAEQHDLPVALVQAVVQVESSFNSRCVSSKGARGLMQVMPATGARFGVADPDHLFYPAPNINAGTAYLAWLLDRYDGNLDLALAAYNAGEGAVDRYEGIPPYRETREYVRKVRKVLARRA